MLTVALFASAFANVPPIYWVPLLAKPAEPRRLDAKTIKKYGLRPGETLEQWEKRLTYLHPPKTLPYAKPITEADFVRKDIRNWEAMLAEALVEKPSMHPALIRVHREHLDELRAKLKKLEGK